jgi:hypothetical protein
MMDIINVVISACWSIYSAYIVFFYLYCYVDCCIYVFVLFLSNLRNNKTDVKKYRTIDGACMYLAYNGEDIIAGIEVPPNQPGSLGSPSTFSNIASSKRGSRMD